MRIRFGWSFGVVCALTSGAGHAWAQGANAASTAPAAPPAAAPVAPAAPIAPTAPVPVPAPAPGEGSPAEASPAPAPAECFPACRSGYTCHEGQCISLCNPVCAAGERCTAAGECEREAPPPPPPPAVLPPAPAAPPPASEKVQAPAGVEPSALRPPGTFVLAAHLGVLLFGAGQIKYECSYCRGTSNVDFRDKSPVVLGVDGLFHVTPGLRLGAGYWLVPYSALGEEPNKASTASNGNEHSLNAIVEGVLPLRPKLALTFRAQGGLHMLTVGGDRAKQNDYFLSSCVERSNQDHCEGMKGPFFGGQYGGAAGILIGRRVRARIDLGLERYSVKLVDQTVSHATTDAWHFQQSTYGTRLWLLAGFEL